MTIRVDARKDLGVTHTAVDGKKYGFGAAHVAATYADDLQDISHNEEFHRQWRVLAEFPADTGQAASARQSLVNRYGPDGSVLGFTFKTVTSLDKKSRAVLVLFDHEEGLSNNPKFSGPPKFRDAAFELAEPGTHIDIHLEY